MLTTIPKIFTLAKIRGRFGRTTAGMISEVTVHATTTATSASDVVIGEPRCYAKILTWEAAVKRCDLKI